MMILARLLTLILALFFSTQPSYSLTPPPILQKEGESLGSPREILRQEVKQVCKEALNLLNQTSFYSLLNGLMELKERLDRESFLEARDFQNLRSSVDQLRLISRQIDTLINEQRHLFIKRFGQKVDIYKIMDENVYYDLIDKIGKVVAGLELMTGYDSYIEDSEMFHENIRDYIDNLKLYSEMVEKISSWQTIPIEYVTNFKESLSQPALIYRVVWLLQNQSVEPTSSAIRGWQRLLSSL